MQWRQCQPVSRHVLHGRKELFPAKKHNPMLIRFEAFILFLQSGQEKGDVFQ